MMQKRILNSFSCSIYENEIFMFLKSIFQDFFVEQFKEDREKIKNEILRIKKIEIKHKM